MHRVDELDQSYLQRHDEKNAACLRRLVEGAFDFQHLLYREGLVTPTTLPQFESMWRSYTEDMVGEMTASMQADARMLSSLFSLVKREEAHVLDEQQERALETEHFLHREFMKEIMRERVGAGLELENALREQRFESKAELEAELALREAAEAELRNAQGEVARLNAKVSMFQVLLGPVYAGAGAGWCGGC